MTERPKLKTFILKLPVHIDEKDDPNQAMRDMGRVFGGVGAGHELPFEVDAYTSSEAGQIMANALSLALRAVGPHNNIGQSLVPVRPIMAPPDEGEPK